MFLDLHEALYDLKGKTTQDRVNSAVARGLPRVSVVAVGGFYIRKRDDGVPTLFGSEVTAERVIEEMRRGQGIEFGLRDLNPGRAAPEYLREDPPKSHLKLTLAFTGVDHIIEHLLQPVKATDSAIDGPRIFLATGTIHDWHDWTSDEEGPSVIREIEDLLSPLFQMWESLHRRDRKSLYSDGPVIPFELVSNPSISLSLIRSQRGF